MELNEQQAAVVNELRQEIVVLAGPGSGKTATMVSRIRADVRRGTDPAGIVVITFTNAAAKEIKERLGMDVGYIGTLHGYCFRILTKFGDYLGYKRNAISIFPEEEKPFLLESIAKFLSIKNVSKKKLMQDPPAEIATEYRFRLKMGNMVDFDMILSEAEALILLGYHDTVAALYVDEAQDSGPVDWNIYSAMKCDLKVFVGDYNQSIYGFRGAAPEHFVARAISAGHLKLTVNYRSQREVCDLANLIIKLCPGALEKEIVPRSEEYGVMSLAGYENDVDEIRMIAARLMQNPMESAILVRTNSLARKLRETLTTFGVPVAADPVPILPEGYRAAKALIACWMNPHSETQARIYLRESGIPQGQIDAIANQCAISGKPLTAAAEFPRHFWEKDLLSFTKEQSVIFVLNCLAQGRIKPEAIAIVAARAKVLAEDFTLSTLDLDLADVAGWSEIRSGTEGVEVLTIHKAKGREWDRVFMPALEDDVFPMKSAEFAEEVRLAFVGITRARKEILLSYAVRRRTEWGFKNSGPSVFFLEAEKSVAHV